MCVQAKTDFLVGLLWLFVFRFETADLSLEAETIALHAQRGVFDSVLKFLKSSGKAHLPPCI